MIPEQRLLLSAILLALSEQDIRYVTWIKYGSTPEDTLRVKTLTQKKALQFVASSDFDELCNQVNVDASRMRAIGPEKAHKLFIKLVDPRKAI